MFLYQAREQPPLLLPDYFIVFHFLPSFRTKESPSRRFHAAIALKSGYQLFVLFRHISLRHSIWYKVSILPFGSSGVSVTMSTSEPQNGHFFSSLFISFPSAVWLLYSISRSHLYRLYSPRIDVTDSLEVVFIWPKSVAKDNDLRTAWFCLPH